MTRIKLDSQQEAIKQFFLSLPADPDGSVLELNGRAVARLTLIKSPEEGRTDSLEQWTEAKNARRCALIDKEIAGTLSPEEASELSGLQNEMLRARRQLAPLPVEDARRLHQELLRKAQLRPENG